jgi:RNA polymerase sigma factor (sigma-70 family)
VRANQVEPSHLSTLLDGIATGDQVAWQETVHRFTGLLRAICLRYRLTPEQSADVAQLTWLQLFTHAHQIRDPRSLGAWLAATARHECLSMLKRDRREVPIEPTDLPWTEEADIDDRIDAAQRGRELHRAVHMLGGRERALVELLLEPELPSYADISRRLEMPIGAVGPVRQRALQRLRRQLTTQPRQEARAVA